MASSKMFHCGVITPEQEVLNTEAHSVVFPAHDGEVGVLVDRAPLVYMMGIGALRVETPKGRRVLFVDGGFAQMLDNQLTILTSAALDPDKIDGEAARASLQEALDMRITTPESFALRQQAIERARAQIRLAGRSVG